MGQSQFNAQQGLFCYYQKVLKRIYLSPVPKLCRKSWKTSNLHGANAVWGNFSKNTRKNIHFSNVGGYFLEIESKIHARRVD